MKIKILKFALVAMIASAMFSACGSSRNVNRAYSGVQVAPTTPAQQTAATRGVRLQRTECQNMALEQTTNLREWGNGVAISERLAVNSALLDARARMAQQLEVMVTGLTRNFEQQHNVGRDGSAVGVTRMVQEGFFEQFLTGTRPICHVTYVREDGQYNVYVTIELDESVQRNIHRTLRQEQMIHIDFQEHQFLQEMQRAREEFRQRELAR